MIKENERYKKRKWLAKKKKSGRREGRMKQVKKEEVGMLGEKWKEKREKKRKIGQNWNKKTKGSAKNERKKNNVMKERN